MSRLRIMSDLHTEFGQFDLEPIGEDVLVLAGDVGVYDRGALWAIEYARRTGVPVVMVAGNHEFYRNRTQPDHTVESTLARLWALAVREPLFHFLEDDLVCVAGVLFVGCTLWTDYALYGDPVTAKLVALHGMNDHRVIADADGHRFLPDHALKLHEFSVGLLRERVPRNYLDGTPLVVVTHHLPSARSISREYGDSVLNPSFASNLDDLVASSGAALWVHGHTHASANYRIGGTRVLCNPRGYHPHELNPDFDRDLVVEV